MERCYICGRTAMPGENATNRRCYECNRLYWGELRRDKLGNARPFAPEGAQRAAIERAKVQADWERMDAADNDNRELPWSVRQILEWQS